MKFGIMFANVGPYVEPDMAAAFGRIAEEHRIESLWAVEHVVVPADYQSQYPYSPSGRMPGPEESPIPDPLIWLTWVGAATTTLRLATGILILPQRNPVILAKELATLDAMRAGAKDAGRDPDAIEVTAGGVLDLDGVRRFADYGVDRVVLPPLGFDLETLREQLGRFSEQVIEKVG